MKLKQIYFLLFFATAFLNNTVSGQQVYKDCKASMQNDTLLIANSKIERKWLWNNGDIIPYSLKNLSSGKLLVFEDKLPAFNIKGRKFIKGQSVNIIAEKKTFHNASHLEISLTGSYEGLDLKRVFKIYPDIAAISCDIYLKYNELNKKEQIAAPVSNGVEKAKRRIEPELSYLDRYALNSRHWQLKAVEFRDLTDDRDNLVFEKEVVPYFAREGYAGDLLFANDLVSGTKFFILKEAPNTTSQINYPGHDFVASNRVINIAVSGFEEKGDSNNWIKGYTTTIGVANETGDDLFTLRKYLKESISYNPASYDMIMMNTWGDRGQDGKISEKFILNELEGAKKLGITHFQIDDGWQQGLSSNSVDKGGNLWDAWTAKDWEPNKERFPNGLKEIIKSAKEKNIELGLWFHPTNNKDYATWRTDADVVTGLYKKHGIKYFKIDGVKIPTKEAEINLTRFFDEVKKATNGEVFFNLDLTADVRGGYYMFRDAGNLFLENRYTDSGRYYPFHTLRNLWMLSKYFPPELLQIEFLNNWRNAAKYPLNDPFAPSNYKFDYIFAISAMAQPLAWLEASNLPSEAYTISPFIKKYQSIMADIHHGTILPIGDKPNGNSWTGFQSLQENSGYFLVFRERNNDEVKELETLLPGNRKVVFEKVYSSNQNASVKSKENGRIEVKLPEQNSFILLKYTFKK